MKRTILIVIILCVCARCGAAQPAAADAAGVSRQSGVITHSIRSRYLGRVETAIHVLLPSTFDRRRRYKVLYILPVVDGETGGKPRWGKPLEVAKKHKFADKYNVICVMATYDRGTLYVNHPTRKDMQHEDYFVKDVVPFIDRQYPTVAAPRGRLLTGFCASGNGAMWLLLRHLDMFGKAAVWDTWLDMTTMHPPDRKQLGTGEIFQKYCVMNMQV
jgi:S-formylglutathione hydrolase FrmB